MGSPHGGVALGWQRTCTATKGVALTLGLPSGVGSGMPSTTAFLKLSPNSTFNTRFSNALRLQIKQRFSVAFASNSNTSGGETFKDRSEGITQPDDSQGPPIATILAGFLAFFLICWVFRSIILWLFSFIVKVPSSK